MDTAFLGIAELGRRYRDRLLTPRVTVDQSLARLVQWEPRLNAFAQVMVAAARADADRLGAELATGRDRGPLHGIPPAGLGNGLPVGLQLMGPLARDDAVHCASHRSGIAI